MKRFHLAYCILLPVLVIASFSIAAQTAEENIVENLPLRTLKDSSLQPLDTVYTIDKINIIGNKKTKAKIILREVSLNPGDQFPLSVLVGKFERIREQLMNTSLFNSATISVENYIGNKIDVRVEVKERWYVFPVPQVSPVDRNLNQWFFEQKASLDRINFGGKLIHNNFTGNNDKLRTGVTFGYTHQLSLSYDRLYFDKQLKWGYRVSFATGQNREMPYNTVNDKQVFLKDPDRFVRKYINTFAELTYRRAIRTRHRFGVGWSSQSILDTIRQLNPSYFPSSSLSLRALELYYAMSHYNVDYIPYPTKGYAAEIYAGKKGFSKNFNTWYFTGKAFGSWHLSPKIFLSSQIYAHIKLPFRQPFINRQFLGYNDAFIQGYEYFVIDGVAGGFLKTTITREILNFKIRVPPVKKGNEPFYIPFRFFAKVYGNTGYVHNPQPGNNQLSNRQLYTGGFGIDILTFYDISFKLDWSFNQLGQNGLFLHRNSIF